jgi:two-component system, chemotaxis family, sensor kinase CheA
MPDANYKDAFLSEVKDYLDSLNSGILGLEKDSENQEFVNQIFRACHTLKGNSAMMGYKKFSKLSHRMENVLGKIRDKKLSVNEEIINLLLQCVDKLEEATELISEHGTDMVDTEHLIEELEHLDNQGSETVIEKKATIGEYVNLSEEHIFKIKEEKDKGNNVYRVIVVFNPTCVLKGTKTQILMKKNTEVIGEIIYSNPDYNDIIKGNNIDSGFDLIVSTKSTNKDIIKGIESVSELKAYVLNVDEKFQMPSLYHKEVINKKIDTDSKKDLIEHFSRPIQSIKVDVKKLDNLVNMVGELLINNMRLNQMSKVIQNTELREIVNNFNLLTSSVQEEIMQQRMVPVGQIFNRFPRLVRDLAVKEKKEIALEIKGEEITLDRNILDEISEPIVHLIRNAIDHGIESKEERLFNNKDVKALIKLTARREKNYAIIEIEDNGAGIDPNKITKKAIEKGLTTVNDAKALSKEAILKFIFHPGFSTKEKVTEISGRGVGMDVVLTKIKKLSGNVKITSDLKKGTKVSLHLPLSLAIITSLIIKIKEHNFAIPLSNIRDTINLLESEIKTIQGNEVILIRNEQIPLVRLGSFFYDDHKYEDNILPVVIIEEGDKVVGLVVDKIINQQPILIKNLHPIVRDVQGITGGTILGDGKVCLIIDVASILN